jgi:hypothetical protein
LPAGAVIEAGLRAVSSAGEHYLDMVGAIGSIPIPPTTFQKSLSCAPERWPYTVLCGVQRVSAITHRPSIAAMGTKHSSAHHGEWPVRLNTIPAGMANSARNTSMITILEVLNGMVVMECVPSENPQPELKPQRRKPQKP